MGSTDTTAPFVFRLATHKAHHLEQTAVPLLVANQNLAGRKTLPRALGPWALDSGGFMQLRKSGRWQFTAMTYLANIARYQAEIGNLEWAAPMDHMCELDIRNSTGKSTAEHQFLTMLSFIELTELWPKVGDGPCPVIPVLQGWSGAEYLWHEEMYRAAGIDLAAFPLVGLGSVCRRSNTMSILRVVIELSHLRLHGFGVKRTGLPMYGSYLASADSAAWSLDARYEPPIEGHTHQHCNNCLEYALNWRAQTLASLN
jgi:hypothetical protein